MICPICGSNVRKSDVFCPKCGAKVKDIINQESNDNADNLESDPELKQKVNELYDNYEKSSRRRRTTLIISIIIGVIVIAAVVIDLIVFGGSDL